MIDCRTVVRFGSFYRTSDSRSLKRYRCKLCQKTFSQATSDPCFGQKKRQKNKPILEHLANANSQRATAILTRVNRKTVARKLRFFGPRSVDEIIIENAGHPVSEMQFDDIETVEQTKLKPISIVLAVESPSRRILGFKVASMPAKGLLANRPRKKYGFRADERGAKRKELFEEIAHLVLPGAIIRSDSSPLYPADVKTYFPECHHFTCLGRRGAVTGQGELKKAVYDPLFSFNHTAAMFRANVSALIRKTWCISKKKEHLLYHLAIYAARHNRKLKAA